MEGTIRNLGKNGCKNYFFIHGADGKIYFASSHCLVDDDGKPILETTAYPYIWPGAKVRSFDIEPTEEGKYDRAVHIRLGDRTSVDKRYWEGRQDALKEFDYWYKKTGITQSAKVVSKYLDQMIGRGNIEKTQVVEMAGWSPTPRYLPKAGQIVLAQVYDIQRNEVFQTFAYYAHHSENNEGEWYAAASSDQEIPDNPPEQKRIAINTGFPCIVQAWMPKPDEYRDHTSKK